jgi:hypothetical protein
LAYLDVGYNKLIFHSNYSLRVDNPLKFPLKELDDKQEFFEVHNDETTFKKRV